MNSYRVLQHETAHITAAIAYLAITNTDEIEKSLSGYGIHFCKDTLELHDVPLANQNKFTTRDLAAASAFGPIVQAGEKTVCEFINHRSTDGCSLSDTDLQTAKLYRGSAENLNLAMLTANALFHGISAVKQARINAVLNDSKAQEHMTLNDLFTVEEIHIAVSKAKQSLLSVETGKGIHIRHGSEKYLESNR